MVEIRFCILGWLIAPFVPLLVVALGTVVIRRLSFTDRKGASVCLFESKSGSELIRRA